ncbi:MAG TPA: hypothetical protein VFW00_08795, partial [Rhodocyclaceae bacterium]|nr:hypothetical protein [Rhodocyclaceae bacterium]
RQQPGYILIAMVLILAAISSVELVRGLNASSRDDAREQRLARSAMREAKMALIGKAVATDNTAGSLLCPDNHALNDATWSGITEGGCAPNGSEDIGCVPWKTLGIPPADQVGIERLWYALSPNFNSSIPTYVNTTAPSRDKLGMQINLDKLGSLALSPAYSNVIAVLIAPGPALNNQTRNATDACGITNAPNYLEAANATANGNLVAVSHDNTFNDTLIPITNNDLYRPLINIVLSQFANTTAATTHGLQWYFAQTNSSSSLLNTPSSLEQYVIPSPSPPMASVVMGRSAISTQFDQQFDTASVLNPGAGGAGCNGVGSSSPSYTQASSWLCYNRWYDYILYRGIGNIATLTLTLPPPSTHSCTLTVNTTSSPDKLVCI